MFHLSLTEVTQVCPKSRVILLQYLAEQLRISLRDDIVECIAVDEGLFDT